MLADSQYYLYAGHSIQLLAVASGSCGSSSRV